MSTDATTLLSRVASRGLYGIEPTNDEAAQDYAKCTGSTGLTAANLMSGVASNKLYGLSRLDLKRVLLYLVSTGGSATTAQQLLSKAAANGFYGLSPLDLKRAFLAMLRYTSICTGAPMAPTNLTVTQTTSSSITFSWSQPLNIPPDTITGYTIKYGTSSGVYTQTQAGSAGVFSATITGLTASTSYFIVVVANNGQCPSANSAELSTSTGSASNQLLQGLKSYWKADDVASPATDSIGGNPLTLASATTGTVNGVINKGFDVHLGSSQASHAAAGGSDFDPLNTSFSISLWVSSTAWNGGAATTIILNNGNPSSNLSTGPYQIYLDNAAQKLICSMFDNAVTQFNLNVTAAYPTNNVFHHVVFTFDTSIKKFSVYYDGAFVTSAVTGNASIYQGVGTTFIIGPGAGNTSLANLTIDEMGMWQKALSQTDVTNLYNGGAALPLASFGP